MGELSRLSHSDDSPTTVPRSDVKNKRVILDDDDEEDDNINQEKATVDDDRIEELNEDEADGKMEEPTDTSVPIEQTEELVEIADDEALVEESPTSPSSQVSTSFPTQPCNQPKSFLYDSF